MKCGDGGREEVSVWWWCRGGSRSFYFYIEVHFEWQMIRVERDMRCKLRKEGKWKNGKSVSWRNVYIFPMGGFHLCWHLFFLIHLFTSLIQYDIIPPGHLFNNMMNGKIFDILSICTHSKHTQGVLNVASDANQIGSPPAHFYPAFCVLICKVIKVEMFHKFFNKTSHDHQHVSERREEISSNRFSQRAKQRKMKRSRKKKRARQEWMRFFFLYNSGIKTTRFCLNASWTTFVSHHLINLYLFKWCWLWWWCGS